MEQTEINKLVGAAFIAGRDSVKKPKGALLEKACNETHFESLDDFEPFWKRDNADVETRFEVFHFYLDVGLSVAKAAKETWGEPVKIHTWMNHMGDKIDRTTVYQYEEGFLIWHEHGPLLTRLQRKHINNHGFGGFWKLAEKYMDAHDREEKQYYDIYWQSGSFDKPTSYIHTTGIGVKRDV